MFIQMNGEGIVNTSEGKPGARAPNFPVEGDTTTVLVLVLLIVPVLVRYGSYMYTSISV